MSRRWVDRLVKRYRKRSQARRLNSRRQLLLEGLERRTLMAGDLMTMTPAMDHVGVTTQMSPAVHACETNDAAQQFEHCAALALVPHAEATHTVVADGNWSNPAVWANQQLPTTGARIHIPQGRILTVDGMLAEEFKTIRVDGTLRFAHDVNTELRVDTLVSDRTGRLEIGTQANPIASDVTARIIFVDDGAIDRSWDPRQLSRGAVLLGQTEIFGAETTHRVTLAVHPLAGTSTLQLNQLPIGWEAGDQLIITGTDGPTSDEVRTIQSIDGTTVTLSQPLEHDHVPPQSNLNVYVANATRNVELTSANPETSRRGHVMLMHTLDVNINFARFDQLGRTDKTRRLDDFSIDEFESVHLTPDSFNVTNGPATNVRSRYSVHLHRGGVDPNSTPAVVNGSVIFDNPGWGLVNHTSNADFTNNVAYAVKGAAFYTEAGDEIGSLSGNIAIRTVNPTFAPESEGAIDPDLFGEEQDFGTDGDGFWLSGTRVSVTDNVAAGSSGHGIIFWTDGLVEPGRGRATVSVSSLPNGNLIPGRETVPVFWAPLAEVRDNESFGATIGFRSRYVHAGGYLNDNAPPPQAYIDTLNPVIDGLTVWGSRDGVLLNYNERLSLRNAQIVGIGAPFDHNLHSTAAVGVGLDLGNEETRGPGSVDNVTIEGFETGLIAPRHDNWVIDQLTLRNVDDILVHEPRQGPRTMTMTNLTFGSLDGTAVAGRDSERRNIVMDPSLEPLGYQPFYFVMPDRITLDGQGIYFNEQAPEFVPLPAERMGEEELARVPNEYFGKTNQQLLDEFGLAFGGALIPNDAAEVVYVTNGVVGTAAEEPSVIPPLFDLIEEEDDGGDEEDDETDEPDEGDQDDADDDGADDDSGEEDEDSMDEEDSDNEDSDDEDTGDSEHEDGCDQDEEEDSEDSDTEDDDEDFDEGGEEHDEEEDSDDDEDDMEELEEEDDDDESDDGEHECGQEDDEGEPDEDELEDEEQEDDEPEDGDPSEEEQDEEDEEFEDQDDSSEDDSGEFDEDEPDEEDEDDQSEEDDDGQIGEQEDESDEEMDDDFHNESDPTDVNNDGTTSPIDAVMVINHLNAHGSGLLQAFAQFLQIYIDVNRDNIVSTIDVLQILNFLNTLVGEEADAEGEAVADLPGIRSSGSTAREAAASPATEKSQQPGFSTEAFPASDTGLRRVRDSVFASDETDELVEQDLLEMLAKADGKSK